MYLLVRDLPWRSGELLQPPPDDETVYQALRWRLLVEPVNGEWRLRVPLMQRWLRERG
jgi:hypothetical protein